MNTVQIITWKEDNQYLACFSNDVVSMSYGTDSTTAKVIPGKNRTVGRGKTELMAIACLCSLEQRSVDKFVESLTE